METALKPVPGLVRRAVSKKRSFVRIRNRRQCRGVVRPRRALDALPVAAPVDVGRAWPCGCGEGKAVSTALLAPS